MVQHKLPLEIGRYADFTLYANARLTRFELRRSPSSTDTPHLKHQYMLRWNEEKWRLKAGGDARILRKYHPAVYAWATYAISEQKDPASWQPPPASGRPDRGFYSPGMSGVEGTGYEPVKVAIVVSQPYLVPHVAVYLAGRQQREPKLPDPLCNCREEGRPRTPSTNTWAAACGCAA
jgi:hypothetical protein